MSYPINYPTPRSANFQAFYGGDILYGRDWVKPQGASMVRFLLIGAGAGGRNGNNSFGGAGGGSGAVTQWVGPAMFVPNVLRVLVGAGGLPEGAGGATVIQYQQKGTNGYSLLTANAGNLSTAGTAMTRNAFGASGIFSSIAGQAGANRGSDIAASTTTFLSGGAGGANSLGADGGRVAARYGYPRLEGVTGGTGFDGDNGFFIFEPIMFGYGGNGGSSNNSAGGVGGTGGKGGIGCGGGGGGLCVIGVDAPGGVGGDGAVFIWSW